MYSYNFREIDFRRFRFYTARSVFALVSLQYTFLVQVSESAFLLISFTAGALREFAFSAIVAAVSGSLSSVYMQTLAWVCVLAGRRFQFHRFNV
jgi:preprotein translocase subunit SecF